MSKNPHITEPAAQFLAREFPVQSPLIARLQEFIPKLSAANEKLQKETQTENTGISIEQIAMKADGEEESSTDSSLGEESDSDQSSNNDEGPHVQFDLHMIGSGAEDSTDEECTEKTEKPKEKKKLIEEID